MQHGHGDCHAIQPLEPGDPKALTLLESSAGGQASGDNPTLESMGQQLEFQPLKSEWLRPVGREAVESARRRRMPREREIAASRKAGDLVINRGLPRALCGSHLSALHA